MEPCLSKLKFYLIKHPIDLVDAVPILDSDQMMELVSKLSLEHERIAFFAGFRLGAQLMLEISGELHTE